MTKWKEVLEELWECVEKTQKSGLPDDGAPAGQIWKTI